MKNVFLAALLLISITTFAQDKKERKGERLTSEQRVEKHVNRLKTDLALNDKQVAEVKTLMTKEAAKRDAKKEEMKAQKEKNRAEMKSKMAEQDKLVREDMKKILTADQFAKWSEQREEMKSKMRGNRQERKTRNGALKDK